jgi:hypothetical protein
VRPQGPDAGREGGRQCSGGRYTFIDKVKVRLVSNTDVAECVNFGSNSLRIADDDVHAFERLLCLCGCPPQARR